MLDELGGSGAVAGLVAAVVVLIKLIEFLINALVKKKDTPNQELLKGINKQKELSHNILTLVTHLDDMHNKYDEDGTPLWYVPRSWVDTQNHISVSLRDMSHTQESMSKVMEKLIKIVDTIDRRQEMFIEHLKAERKG